MAVVDYDSADTQELREHRRSFMTFERMVLFAIMHIALVLSCLALAFLGDVPLVAFLLGAGGTIALITAFVVTAPSNRT
jgi:energy-converting hydrogenase Eha subunit C